MASDPGGISIIGITCELNEKKNVLRSEIKKIESIGELLAVSNIYKKNISKSLHGELWAVIKLKTELRSRDLKDLINKINKDSECQTVLLAYDNIVSLDPQCTLPEPLLWSNRLFLKCASEAWPTFVHPILKKTLLELAKELETPSDIEFFAQGKVLI